MKLNAVHLVQNWDVEAAMSLTNPALIAIPWLRDALNGKLSTDETAREVTPEQAEISRLRAELARSRHECALEKHGHLRTVPQEHNQTDLALIAAALAFAEAHVALVFGLGGDGSSIKRENFICGKAILTGLEKILRHRSCGPVR